MSHRTSHIPVLATLSMEAPAIRGSSLWTRLEAFFVRWQARRLVELPVERLWAQAMQDTRSLAEIRRSQG